MKRAALYVRVSTVEQREEGQSVDSQIDALQEYAKENNYAVAGVYNDAGISAHVKYTRRPELLRLINDAKAGQIDVILVTKLDRFFRSVKDYYAVMDQLGSVSWRAIWEDYETETSGGIFKVNIMLSVAQAESDRTSERVKAVNDYRRARGEFVGGKIPIGYLLENKQLVKDPTVQPAISDFFQAYLRTYSIARAIHAADNYNIHLSYLRAKRILKSEVYAGNAYGHSCDGYITPEEYSNIIDSFAMRKTDCDGKAHRVYLFSGLLRCEKCGGVLGAHYTSKVAYGKRYHYKAYRCCQHENRQDCVGVGTVYEGAVEKYLLSEMDRIISEHIAALSIKSKKTTPNNENKVAKLRAKLARVGERYEDGDISRDEYVMKRDAIKEELRQCERALNGPSPVLSAFPQNWKDMYSQMDDEHKRMFWNRVIKKITRTADRNLIIELL